MERRHPSAIAATLIVLALALVGSSLATVMIWREQGRTRAALAAESVLRTQAVLRERVARRHLYAADMNLAHQAWDLGNVAYALELLERHRPAPGEVDLRGFEWNYLWRLCGGARELEIARHARRVGRLAFSPDGARLASGADDGTIVLSDGGGTGSRMLIEAHRQPVTALAFAANGERLASASSGDDHSIAIWDSATGRELWRGTAPSTSVPDLALAADKERLVTLGERSAILWNTSTSQIERQIALPVGSDAGMAATADGRALVTSGAASEPLLWDLATGKLVRRFAGLAHGSFPLALAPDGQTLAAGGNGWTVLLWDVGTGNERIELGGDAGGAYSISFSSDCRYVGVLQHARSFTLWDLVKGSVSSQGVAENVRTALLAPDGHAIALGHDDGTVTLKPTANPASSIALDLPQDRGRSLTFTPDSATLVTGSIQGNVTLWDVAGARPRQVIARLGKRVPSLACSPDGALLAAACGDRTVRVWDLTDGSERAVFTDHDSEVKVVAFSRQGGWLASGDRGGTVKIRRLATTSLQAPIALTGTEVLSLAWFGDGRRLARANSDGSVEIWDVMTGRLVRTLKGAVTNQVLALAISPDDRSIAGGHAGGALNVWDATTGLERAALRGHRFSPRSLAFFPDGESLASGSVDGTVRIWDLAIGQSRATLKVPGGAVQAMAVSQNGETLATIAADGSVRLWSAGRHEWNEPAESSAMSDLEKLGDAHALMLAHNLAWALATCADMRLRNPRRALALAQAAVRARRPSDVGFHNTLGVAYYRVGDWNSALAELERSTELRAGGDSFDWFFLAMAHWQRGQRDQSRKWLQKAQDWMDKKAPRNRELVRFRAEAEALIELPARAPLPEAVKP